MTKAAIPNAAMATREPLAILAGGGALPAKVADAAAAAGRKVLILAVAGEADPVDPKYRCEEVSWGQIGRVTSLIKAHGATDIVMAGAIGRRPDYSKLRLDWLGVKSLPRLLSLVKGGDDQLLVGVINFIESLGFRIVGPHEVAPDLVATPGTLTKRQPQAGDLADIAAAATAAIAVGRLDAGQGAVAVREHIVALEGLEGTDSMLHRVRELRDSGRLTSRKGLGVIAKWSKPDQDLRVDMPTIGPMTVAAAAAAGLAGIAIEARRVMLLDRAAAIAAADAAGLFIVAREQASGSTV